MDTKLLVWGSLGLYVGVTAFLAWRGYRKTRTLTSFAVGSGDIAPWVVGLSLAAQLTSVATFVANPGLVFAYGLAGLLGFGVAAAAGITVGLVVFSRAFRRIGTQLTALTVPQWIGARFKSKPLATGFGVVSLALVSYAVLIVVVLSHVLNKLTGLPTWAMALAVVVFVFTYVLLGGVNTHAYTNAVQAIIMLVVAVLLIGSVLPGLFEGEGLFARLAAEDPVLVQAVNPSSLYFRNLFEVFVCNALVGLALVCQPHILSKALYLKHDKDVRRYLAVAIAAGVVFAMVMWVGLSARTQIPATTPYDQVVPVYIFSHFSGPLRVLISIGLLAAGISTLEGILLALSTIVSADLYLGVFGNNLLKRMPPERQGRSALWVSRATIVVLGVITYLLTLTQIENPTGGSVAIFAMFGVYLVIATSFVPLAAGMFLKNCHRAAAAAGAVAAAGAYILTWFVKWSSMANNPAFLGTVAILAGWVAFVMVEVFVRWRRNRHAGSRAPATSGASSSFSSSPS